MKELSIEQKAKRYDEAIEIAREYDFSLTGVCAGDVIQDIFPELKESEGERMRNAAINACKYMVDNFENSTKQYEDAIAWLEKQAEKKPAEWHREDEQNLNSCLGYIPDEFLRRWLMDAIHVKYDKPADKVEPKFNVGDKIYLKPEYRMPDDDTPIANTVFEIRAIDDKHYRFDGSYIFIEDQDKYELVERKPTEWSEVDETTKNNISHIIRQYDKISKRNNQPCCYVGDCLLWMQNIKDRVQPKQEWSEKDGNLLSRCVCDFDYLIKNENRGFEERYKEQIAWLKSLKPQSQWKPSLSQLNALGVVAKGNVPDDIEEINSLYNDLKKLKG